MPEMAFVSADSSLPSASGVCSETISWNYDSATNTLTLSGTGRIPDRSYSNSSDTASYGIYSSQVKNLVLCEGITEVGTYGFSDFYYLESLSLPESLTLVDNRGFSRTSSIQELHIKKNLTSFPTEVLARWDELKSIEVDGDNPSYLSENGILYNKDKTMLIHVPDFCSLETLRIPETVTAIHPSAFAYNRNLISLYLPSGLEEIGDRSLSSFYQLEHLVFLGKAPVFPSYMGSNFATCTNSRAEKLHVYCSFSAEGWENIRSTVSSDKFQWVNLDTTDPGVCALSIACDTDTVTVGGSIQLRPSISPIYTVGFFWESSDGAIADVMPDGTLTGNSPGKAVITVTSIDGAYQAQKEFTVIGEVSQPNVDSFAFGSGEPFENISKDFLQIPCERKNGIYVFSDSHLYFYSLSTRVMYPLYTFQDVVSTYSDQNLLYVASMDTCQIYDLISRRITGTIRSTEDTFSAVGADALGRVYLAGTKKDGSHGICLFTKEGAPISNAAVPSKILRFNAFDGATGNFYVEAEYDWFYWGYSHPGHALFMGNVTDNVITMKTNYQITDQDGDTKSADTILYLCQYGYRAHRNSAALLAGRYLVAVSSLYNLVQVLDTANGGLKVHMEFSRDAIEAEGGYYDEGSVGVRAVYHSGHHGLLLYENNCLINEYDLATGEALASYTTKYPVFDMFWMGKQLILVEKKDSQFYIESVLWGDVSQLSISGPDTMKVGEYSQINLDCDAPYAPLCEWSSSDPKILSVTDQGCVSAWKKGSAVITAAAFGRKVQKRIQVVSEKKGKREDVFSCDGTISNNLHENSYSNSNWSSVVNSYLYEKTDKSLCRVEYNRKDRVLVEEYNTKGRRTNEKSLEKELPLFGGFYHGKSANYLVFGQNNPKESDQVEIMRVVKYSHDWIRLGDCRFYGNNTSFPFDAGSLRMAEAGDLLYIHTCHEMYASDDGLNHQANMTYVIYQSTMKEQQSYYRVMNFAAAGYVSHSFNQFVKTDDRYVFRVDHGDAYPRAISLSRADVGGDITEISGVYAHKILGKIGDNYTGVTVGGFELSGENCLIAFSSRDMTSEAAYKAGNTNIYVSVISKSMTSQSTKQITNYTKSDSVAIGTPQLVKLNDYQFLLMWTEYRPSNKSYSTRMVTMDGQANITSDIAQSDTLQLSDCQPIYASDGLVKWYTTDGKHMYLYTLDPYNLDGDPYKPDSKEKTKTKKPVLNVSGTLPLQRGKSIALKVRRLSRGDKVKRWKSSNPKVAYVSKKGKVTGKKTGKAVISAVLKSGKTLKVTVRVQKGIVKTKKLTVPKKSISLKKGKTYSIKPVRNPITSGQKVTYTSSNKKIASVTSKGVVKGLKKGKARITVKSGSKKVVVTVKVK
ncbi:MAG: Ig-like domain-containing protein [Eubacteriales bacterium]|nr:Ig-like domain-containing protein [Eubacteriales bacterium]